MAWSSVPPNKPGWWGFKWAPINEPKLTKVVLHEGYLAVPSSWWCDVAVLQGEWWDEPIKLPWEDAP